MKQFGRRTICVLLGVTLTAALFSGCKKSGELVSSGVSGSAVSESSAVSGGSGVSRVETIELDFSKGLTADGYFEGVTASDYVMLPDDYRSMEIPAEISRVDEAEIRKRIESFLSAYSTMRQVTDRTVKDGDTVNIDYVGSIDGVEFSGGNTGGNGTTVTIGVTSYIDDFLEQLIGHQPGDTFDVNVTFPTPYENNPDLAGKDAVFKTTINFIEETETSQWNDEFVKNNLSADYGWTSAKQAEEEIEKTYRENAELTYLWDKLLEKVTVEKEPEEIAAFHRRSFDNQYLGSAKNYGLSLEEYLEQYQDGETLDELAEREKETLKEDALRSLVLQAISEDLDLKVKDEQLSEYFEEYFGSPDYTEYEKSFGKPYLYMAVRENLARRSLLENAVRGK